MALMCCVAAAVTVVHWPVLGAQALGFDDTMYLAENPLVRNPSWSSAWRFASEVLEPSSVRGYYQPLAMISLMLDCATGGSADNLRAFHRTSLLLHILNTMLLIALLHGLFGHAWVAASLGLLFGVHPMTVEPLAWVGERKTPLATLFALAALLVYVEYVRRPARGRYVGSLGLYVLALLSKPTTTPLPALLLLLDFWPLRRLGRRALVEKVPFFVLGAAFAVVTYISQSRTASTFVQEAAPLRVPLILCHNIVFYLWKIVWPSNLTPHTPFPEPFTAGHPAVLAGVIGTAALMVVLIVSLRWTRAWLTGWLFFFVAILPTMGVIGFTMVIASDKYAYLPAVGLLLPLAWGLGLLDLGSAGRRRAALRAAGAVTLVVLAGAAAGATRHQLGYWQTTEKLAQHMVRLAPNSHDVRLHYGYALRDVGRPEEAIGQLELAIRLAPDVAKLRSSLGTLLYNQGRLDEAIEQYRAALRKGDNIRLFPERARTLNNLAAALLQKGELEAARSALEEALRIRPDLPNALSNLGLLHARQGDNERATACFTAALRSDPRDHLIRANLGAALLDANRVEEALVHLKRAVELKPRFGYGHHQLGRAWQRRGQGDAAIAEYLEAIRLDPDRPGPHIDLATLLATRNRHEEALRHYREALRVKPDHAATQANAGIMCAQLGRLEEAVEHLSAAVRLEPTLISARDRLALVLIDLGRPGEAITQYRLALQDDPNNPALRTNLGNVLGATGHAAEALEEYRAALRLDPSFAAAHYGMGVALEESGQVEEALAAYRESLRLDPENAAARERVQALQAGHGSTP